MPSSLVTPLSFPFGGPPPTGVVLPADKDPYGKDVAFPHELTAKGDYQTVDGEENLRLAVRRRLMTSPGTFRTRPTYGAGVPDYVKQRKTKTARDELTARILEQVSQERRVEKVLEVLLEDITTPGAMGLKVTVRVQAFGRSIRPLVYNFSKEA